MTIGVSDSASVSLPLKNAHKKFVPPQNSPFIRIHFSVYLGTNKKSCIY